MPASRFAQISLPNIKSRRTQNGHAAAKGQGTDKGFASAAAFRLTFEDYLRSLESCPDLFRWTAKTAPEIQKYTTALCRWQETGYPHPGDWPHTKPLHIDSYIHS
jgi:hypothetical protein